MVLSALADPVRMRILDLLGPEDTCVCELQGAVDVASNLLSYHLRVLREAGLVGSRRRGRWVDYHLLPGAAEMVESALPRTVRPGRT